MFPCFSEPSPVQSGSPEVRNLILMVGNDAQRFAGHLVRTDFSVSLSCSDFLHVTNLLSTCLNIDASCVASRFN